MSTLNTTDFVISRTFNASKERVWHAFTNAEALAKWWGPKGFDIKVHALDVRPGGTFHYSMETPNNVMWGKFVYREIEPMDRMVYVSSFSDESGGVTRAPFNIPFPLEVLNHLTFTEQDGKTTIELRGGPINASQEEIDTFAGMHESMRGGFGGTFDQLDAYLAS